jgi:sugar/nucleoside kinase (ribokinase family)
MLVADTVGRPIDALPQKGTLGLIERIELHVGGCGANTSAALARLGMSVALLGKVGSDGFGEYLTTALTAKGVDTRGVRQDASTTTAATIVTVHSDAERSFLHVPGANPLYTVNDVDWEILADAKILHIAGHSARGETPQPYHRTRYGNESPFALVGRCERRSPLPRLGGPVVR